MNCKYMDIYEASEETVYWNTPIMLFVSEHIIKTKHYCVLFILQNTIKGPAEILLLLYIREKKHISSGLT